MIIKLLLGLALGLRVFAAEASPTATVASDRTKQIEDLKERLATKVAELRQKERRAIYGTVKTVSVTSAIVETTTKDVKIDLPDDLKIMQIIKGKRTTLTLEDLAKGDVVTVFGEYDATLDLLKAKVIFIQGSLPERVSGTIKEIDKTDFTLAVVTPAGPTYTIDIEKSTKTNFWDGQTATKAGFSKISVGDTVHIVGTAVPKKENRLSAIRILDLGDLTGTRPTVTATPTKETSPSATPRPTSKSTPTP